MKNEILKFEKQTLKYSWTCLLVGVISILLGMWATVTPQKTLLMLSFIFSLSFITSGIFELIFSLFNRDSLRGWGWGLVSAIIDILFGILLLSTPLGSLFILMLFIGFWVLFHSILSVGSAIELKQNNVRGWGFILFLSILGAILGLTLIINPVFASGFLIIVFSFSLISYGVQRIFYANRQKAMRKEQG